MAVGTIAKGNGDHRNWARNLRWNYSRNELFVNKIVKEKSKAHDKQAKIYYWECLMMSKATKRLNKIKEKVSLGFGKRELTGDSNENNFSRIVGTT